MKKFFQKQREVIVILVYIGVIAMLICFVILPLITRISSTKDQIQEEYVKQEINQQQISELPKIEEQYNVLQSNGKLIDVLLDKNDAVPLIEKLEKLAQDSNNKISISIQDTKDQKNAAITISGNIDTTSDLVKNLPSADYLQMQITLTGNYNAVVQFVHSLESFEYYCDIVAIQIKQKEEDNNTAEMSMINPFNSKLPTSINKISNLNNKEASLAVVFYTKK